MNTCSLDAAFVPIVIVKERKEIIIHFQLLPWGKESYFHCCYIDIRKLEQYLTMYLTVCPNLDKYCFGNLNSMETKRRIFNQLFVPVSNTYL